MLASVRRWGLAGLAAAVGLLLLASGLAVAVVDAQLRSDAATAAVTLTAQERQQLEGAEILESVATDAGYFRRMLIMQNLASGGIMPERAFEIHEEEDGNVSLSWGYHYGFGGMGWVGWRMNPVGILSFTGLALLICSLFAAAARWESKHPLVSN
jgi:hypothetical protein